MTRRILFVCLGNICRSPAAEGIMRHLVETEGLAESIKIDSAGTYGGHAGSMPDDRMRQAAYTRGYKLVHKSRKITYNDFDDFDMIIVMDDSNYENVCRLAPTKDHLQKIFRMTEFCREKKATYVPDPYYEGADGFYLVLDLLEDACTGLLDDIKTNKV